MLTIEGICDQLHRYNEHNKVETHIRLNWDTSCGLYDDLTDTQVQWFGNIHQLMVFFTKNTGVRK